MAYATPDENPALVYVGSLPSPASRRVMAGTLEQIARILSDGRIGSRHFPWAALRPEQTSALRARLIRSGRAPATTARYLHALRGALKAAWRLGQLGTDVYQRAADLGPVTERRLPRGRALESGEVDRLFEVCAADPSRAGIRDAAIVAVFIGAGLRRAEVASLDVRDYDGRSGEIRVRSGKGRRERVVYAPDGAAKVLDDWLRVRGAAAGPLFVPITKGGTLQIRRMTEQAIYAMLQRRRREAGLAAFSPHDLRRTFVSELLDAGVDLATVQRLAGHASVASTVLYDRRGARASKRAAMRVHVPYVREP